MLTWIKNFFTGIISGQPVVFPYAEIYTEALKRIAKEPTAANFRRCAEAACRAAVSSHGNGQRLAAEAYATAAQTHAASAALCATAERDNAALLRQAAESITKMYGKLGELDDPFYKPYWDIKAAADRAAAQSELSAADAKAANNWARTCAGYK